MTFTTKIYHPGINEEGAICVPVLRDEVCFSFCVYTTPFQIRSPPNQWKPSVNLSSGEKTDLSYDMRLPASKVLSIIQEKVNNPSPDDPFEPDIAAVILYMSRLLISGDDQSPQLLKTDKTKFLATAKEWTKK